MDVETMKTELPKWPLYVQPLVNTASEMEAERGVPMPTCGLAMICAGWTIVSETIGPNIAATALLAALDNLRESHPADVEQAEAVHRRRHN